MTRYEVRRAPCSADTFEANSGGWAHQSQFAAPHTTQVIAKRFALHACTEAET
jgi:hypothetical protein